MNPEYRATEIFRLSNPGTWPGPWLCMKHWDPSLGRYDIFGVIHCSMPTTIILAHPEDGDEALKKATKLMFENPETMLVDGWLID